MKIHYLIATVSPPFEHGIFMSSPYICVDVYMVCFDINMHGLRDFMLVHDVFPLGFV